MGNLSSARLCRRADLETARWVENSIYCSKAFVHFRVMFPLNEMRMCCWKRSPLCSSTYGCRQSFLLPPNPSQAFRTTDSSNLTNSHAQLRVIGDQTRSNLLFYLGIKPATSKLRAQHPDHYTTLPPLCTGVQ